MNRSIVLALVLAIPFVHGCAGPAKLAEKSQEKLAKGEMWRAWSLATRALDKAPANTAAKSAAAAAANAIAEDWRRRIRGLAEFDSLNAAEQVIEFAAFRANAVRYTTVPASREWVSEEHALRHAAARFHYEHGVADLEAERPKRGYGHLIECERFVQGYRDALALAGRARESSLTRVAFLPLGGPSRSTIGREVAESWAGDVLEHMPPTGEQFTRVLPATQVEREIRVSDLARMSRDQALRIGRRVGADRVVWGSIGDVNTKNSVHVFSDVVARRVVEKDERGRRTTRWEDVPIEVIARVRTVEVDLEYEVLASQGGATLARQRGPCTMSARAVWTAYVPQGNAQDYALVSEPARRADPKRATQIEQKWKAVAGENASLAEVLEAKRASVGRRNDQRQAIANLMAGAAFVLLEELPSSEDLAFAALRGGWREVHADLMRLDPVDDIDLGLATAESIRR